MTKISLPDKRTNAYRNDLADAHLSDHVIADSYVEAKAAITVAARSSMRRGPGIEYSVDKELLRGEKVKVFETKDDWSWVQSVRDNYVGYCKSNDVFENPLSPNTHRVNSLRSLLFQEPNLKSYVTGHLSLNCEVTVTKEDGKFSLLDCGNWIFTTHLLAVNNYSYNFIDAAFLYQEAPYLWGGNSNIGVDCSGLVQMAALAVGHTLPRDADMQEEYFEEQVSFSNDPKILKSNDLLFWPGHVGIYIGGEKVLHANATEMKTCVHDLNFLLAHIEKIEGTPLRSVKRPNFKTLKD